MPHVIHQDVNGLGLIVQLKRNFFFGTSFVVAEPKLKVKRGFECTTKRKKYVIHQANCRTKQEKKIAQGQLSNASFVETVYVENIHSVYG